MARTRRAVPYKNYWGSTKKEAKKWWEETRDNPQYRWERQQGFVADLKRDYLLHGTDARNYCYPTHEWFNFANRVNRRDSRDQLRPHIVLGDNCEFDDSHARRKYKGVWWSIY